MGVVIMNKARVLVVLVILIASSVAEKPSLVEARTLSLTSHQGYSKIFATLGIVCKCCDGVEGACTSTWKESCSNLQCSPWKFHTHE